MVSARAAAPSRCAASRAWRAGGEPHRSNAFFSAAMRASVESAIPEAGVQSTAPRSAQSAGVVDPESSLARASLKPRPEPRTAASAGEISSSVTAWCARNSSSPSGESTSNVG
jgi:hypothetical protein